MIKEFQPLSAKEQSLMMDAVPLVTILIAGADGNFSKTEKEWAKKLANIRSYNSPESMAEYYQQLEENFEQKIENLLAILPADVPQRNQVISGRLAGLNSILPKLNNNFSHRFYKNLLSFADHIARADGGFLRFASINKEEKKWLNLPMINEVELIEEDDQ